MFDVLQIQKVRLHLARRPLVYARLWFAFCESKLDTASNSRCLFNELFYAVNLLTWSRVLIRKSPSHRLGRATSHSSRYARATCLGRSISPSQTNLDGSRLPSPWPRCPHSRRHDGLVPEDPPTPTRSAPRPNPGGCDFAQTRRWLIVELRSTLRGRVANVPAGV